MLNFSSKNAIKLATVISPLVIIGCFGSQAALAGGSRAFYCFFDISFKIMVLDKILIVNQIIVETELNTVSTKILKSNKISLLS
jgi:hypothetical protein